MRRGSGHFAPGTGHFSVGHGHIFSGRVPFVAGRGHFASRRVHFSNGAIQFSGRHVYLRSGRGHFVSRAGHFCARHVQISMSAGHFGCRVVSFPLVSSDKPAGQRFQVEMGSTANLAVRGGNLPHRRASVRSHHKVRFVPAIVSDWEPGSTSEWLVPPLY